LRKPFESKKADYFTEKLQMAASTYQQQKPDFPEDPEYEQQKNAILTWLAERINKAKLERQLNCTIYYHILINDLKPKLELRSIVSIIDRACFLTEITTTYLVISWNRKEIEKRTLQQRFFSYWGFTNIAFLFSLLTLYYFVKPADLNLSGQLFVSVVVISITCYFLIRSEIEVKPPYPVISPEAELQFYSYYGKGN
jgi:hypothetical protein